MKSLQLIKIQEKKKNLTYGQNKRSAEHLKLYGDKPFDKSASKISSA